MNAKRHQLRLADYLSHMLEASKLARSYVEGVDLGLFQDNRLIQQGVILNLIVIGEAAVQIVTEYPDFAAANQDVQWSKLRGMRNRMAHGYFDINLQTVWDTLQTSLPELERFLEHCPELSQSEAKPRSNGLKP